MAEFGVRLPVAGPLASARAVLRVARAAERFSFGFVSANDSIAWSSLQNRTHISSGSIEAVRQAGEDQPANFLESLSTLSFVAGATERIGLLSSVLVLPFRDPVVAAKQVASLDVLSGGRLTLGIGVGATRQRNSTNFELLGVPRSDKYARTVDYLRAMRAIWTMDRPRYSGRYLHFDETQIDPKPVQKPYPPIWVGGSGDKSMRIAAELADGWIPAGLSVSTLPRRIAELARLASEFGRPVPRVCSIGAALIAHTVEEARAMAGPTLAAKAGTQEPPACSGLVGSPAFIVELIARYKGIGVSTFELLFIYHSLDHYLEQLEMFAAEVLPHV